MKTGIQFFDEREFQPGDVVVLAGFTGSGKSMVSTAIAVGLAKHNDGEVLHVNLESTRGAWVRRVETVSGDVVPHKLTYRNVGIGTFLPSELGKSAVVLDHIGLVTAKDDIHEFVRVAKSYAVRQQTVVVIATQVGPELGRHLSSEGWVDPLRLPEWVLEFGDRVFMLCRPNADIAITEVKDPEGRLYGSPTRNGSLNFVPR